MAKTQLRYVIGADLTQAEKAFKSMGNSIDRAGKKFTAFGKASSAAITVPLTALVGLSARAAIQIDDALDDIRIGTGATGAAFKALEADFKAIATAVPQGFGDSAKAIADFNTLTGASGKQLQDLSLAALDASRMMKKDLGGTIASTGKLMNNWRIPVDQGVELMDKLFVASQSTGMGMDAIASAAMNSGAALRQMGFSLDESIALVASLDKEGIQAEQILKSLNKALGTLAKAGVTDTSKAFDQIINSIKNAKTDSDATAKAMQIFGSKAGPELAAAIREGRFGVDDLTKALQGAGGAIKQTAADTDSFSEKLGRVSNELGMALEPLGARILGMAEKEMPHLTEAIKNYTLNIDDATIKTIAIAAALGPATMAMGAFVSSVGVLIKTSGTLLSLFSGPVGLMVAIAGTAWGLGELINNLSDTSGKADQTTASMRALKKANDDARESFFATIDPASVGAGYASPNAPDKKTIARYREYEELLDKIKVDPNIAKVEAQEATKRTSQTQKTPYRAKITPVVKGTDSEFNFSQVEKFADSARDQIKYLSADGNIFMAKIEAMQAKLKPLSDDWKALEDLKINIKQDSLDKALQGFQDQIKYFDKNGIEFTPDLQKLQAQFTPLSEEWKRIQDLIKAANEEVERIEGKKWQGLSWDFAEGFYKADEYASILQEKLSGLDIDSDKWRETFSELQTVMEQMATKDADRLGEMLSKNKIKTVEWNAAITALIAKYNEFPNIVQYLRDLQEEQQKNKKDIIDLNALTLQWAQDLQSGIADAIVEGNNLNDVLQNIGKEIAKVLIKMALFGKNGGGGLLGNLFGGLLGSADGNVFSGGSLVPFAKGGVVNGPTIFPMANGAGLMGEAGPEAVMPLKRGADGKLGVVASSDGESGGGTVIINLSAIDAGGVAKFLEQNRQQIISMVAGDYMRNGTMRRVLQGG